MRSAVELRARWLDQLPLMITRAGMYTTSGGAGFDLQMRTLLANLCYLDEREQDHDRVHKGLHDYGKLGVVGPFQALFGKRGNYTAEVASVWAEQLHRLGYLHVDRLIDTDTWTRLTAGLRERFDGADVHRSEVEAAYGPPSIIADKRVLCYATAGNTGWVFIDTYTEPTHRYIPGKGNYAGERDEDPLVRCVRQPAADFESGLILTLYGKVLRWGPGWWLDHPSGLSDVQQAIAAQLRQVEAADPSQALKPPRGHPLREPGT